MIKTFKQAWLEEFWESGKHKRVPSELEPRLLRQRDMLNWAAAHKFAGATLQSTSDSAPKQGKTLK